MSANILPPNCIECPDCRNGLGEPTGYVRCQHWNEDMGGAEPKRCPTCQGRGYISSAGIEQEGRDNRVKSEQQTGPRCITWKNALAPVWIGDDWPYQAVQCGNLAIHEPRQLDDERDNDRWDWVSRSTFDRNMR